MPLFEYECLECRRFFEILVKNGTQEVACPHCQSAKLSKQFSSFAVGAEAEADVAGCPARPQCPYKTCDGV